MKARPIILLLAAILLTQLIACGQEGIASSLPDSDGTAASAEPDTTTVPEETVVPLGIEKEDNGGRDFHILVPTEKNYEFVTESNGEVVNDAMLARSQKAEELFNIRFSYQYEPGGWDTRDPYNKIINGG